MEFQIFVFLVLATVVIPGNGNVADIEKYRYLASIHEVASKKFVCSGSIIGDYWILTAGHCLVKGRSYNIRVGSKYYDKEGHLLQVRNVFIHSQFTVPGGEYDIGLLYLYHPIMVSTRARLGEVAVELPPDPGYNGTVVGWARTEKRIDELTALRYSDVQVVDCQDKTNNVFCAKPKGEGSEVAASNHGAPFVTYGQLHGILINHDKAKITTYTAISRYHNWIENVFDSIESEL